MAEDFVVYAKLPDGTSYFIGASPNDTVWSLRKIIASHASLDPSKVVVTFAGKTLQDTQTMKDARVKNESILHIVMKGGGGKGKETSSTSSSSSSSMHNDQITAELVDSFQSNCTKGVDICFIFDTTGSMYSVLEQVRQQLQETTETLFGDLVGIRVSIMAVGDYCDQNIYVVDYVDFSNNPETIVEFVRGVRGTSGGDSPEAYEWALHKCRQLSWREDEDVGKAVVLIADAEPHPPSYTTADIFWQDELEVLADMDIKVYGVQALQHKHVTPFYKRLAERTGGLYLQFSNFHLITQMFLAVCYREAGEEKLKEFKDKTGAQGGEMVKIFKNLEAPLAQKKIKKTKINCNKQWYTGCCGELSSYYYNHSTDTFSPATKGKGEGMGGCMASNEGGASGSGIYSGGSSFGATAVPTDYGGIYGAEDKKKKKKKGFF